MFARAEAFETATDDDVREISSVLTSLTARCTWRCAAIIRKNELVSKRWIQNAAARLLLSAYSDFLQQEGAIVGGGITADEEPLAHLLHTVCQDFWDLGFNLNLAEPGARSSHRVRLLQLADWIAYSANKT
jgi:hypothetical protein